MIKHTLSNSVLATRGLFTAIVNENPIQWEEVYKVLEENKETVNYLFDFRLMLWRALSEVEQDAIIELSVGPRCTVTKAQIKWLVYKALPTSNLFKLIRGC